MKVKVLKNKYGGNDNELYEPLYFFDLITIAAKTNKYLTELIWIIYEMAGPHYVNWKSSDSLSKSQIAIYKLLEDLETVLRENASWGFKNNMEEYSYENSRYILELQKNGEEEKAKQLKSLIYRWRTFASFRNNDYSYLEDNFKQKIWPHIEENGEDIISDTRNYLQIISDLLQYEDDDYEKNLAKILYKGYKRLSILNNIYEKKNIMIDDIDLSVTFPEIPMLDSIERYQDEHEENGNNVDELSIEEIQSFVSSYLRKIIIGMALLEKFHDKLYKFFLYNDL